jgi:hypothetical protein
LLSPLSSLIERVDAGVPSTASVAEQTVVIVNAPFDVAVSYLQVARAADGRPRPKHLHWLATASSELRVQTLDRHTLRIAPARGFLLTPSERHYRGDPSTLRKGARVELSELTVHVTQVTTDGRPAVIEARLREPLDSPRLLLRAYRHGRLEPFVPPAPGQSVTFPREDYIATLARQVLDPSW